MRDEQIDHMRAAPIYDRRHGLAVDVVEPSAEQQKALRGQVHDRRRDIGLAVEPRLYRMLIARAHVGEMVGLKRAHMRRYDVAEQALVLVRSNDGDEEGRGHCGR